MELEDWIDVAVLSTGRRLFVLEQMKAAAQALEGNDDVVAWIGRALASEHQTRTLETQWSGVRSGNGDSAGMGALDGRLDKAIAAVRDGAEVQRQGAAPDDPIHATVAEFLQQALPEGVFAITSLPHVDELSAADALLRKLRGPLADQVTELGLSRQVNRIAEILPEYEAALRARGELVMTFAPVREARRRGQRYLLELVAMVLGRYPLTEDPAHKAARERLLRPLWKQMQAARALRGRRAASRARPGAGEPTPGEPSGGAPAA
jgi:hypothetical protein